MADDAKRENRRELARLLRDADLKRKTNAALPEGVPVDGAGGEDTDGGAGRVERGDLNEGRKEHLRGMQASLAQLKEQLKSGDKGGPKAKRETRAVRKDK